LNIKAKVYQYCAKVLGILVFKKNKNIIKPVIYKSHWIITITAKRNFWKCKIKFPTDTLKLLYVG